PAAHDMSSARACAAEAPAGAGRRRSRLRATGGGGLSPPQRLCETHAVETRKLETTDAFVIFDLEGADRAVGVIRLAPKILVDGAASLARSQTYELASFERRFGGASGGINAKPADRDEAVKAF